MYRGFVVSHTHWDRAWYLPFQTFRHRLVRMVDRLMELLDDDPAFKAFTLDGQAILLEDYLEIRPDQEDRLRRFIEDGRLLIGPWYTLPDLFLVSEESVIRNLQVGLALCERFGGRMPVGYIPDPFGHFAQMPQILRGFDLDTYIFMRGMSQEMKETHGALFDWAAPDGSTVLAVYQRQGYFAAAALGHPEPFGRFEGHAPEYTLARKRVRRSLQVMTPLQETPSLLLSNGFDHMPEQPEVPPLLDALNEEMSEIDLVHSTLPAYVAAVHKESGERRTYEGDLLGNADHPILSSVYSARMYLKQRNHHAESRLTRYVEPLSAWMQMTGRGEDPHPFLDHAWRLLLRNHPHDDICGCSVDAVHDDDEYRFRQVEQIAESVWVEHLEALVKEGFEPPAVGTRSAGEAKERLSSDVWIYNPHPWAHTARVRTRILMPNPEGEKGKPTPRRSLRAVDGNGNAVPVAVRSSEGRVVRSNFLEATWGRRYEVVLDVPLPAMGYQVVHVYEAEDEPPPARKGLSAAPESTGTPAGTPVLENETYRLTVEDAQLVLTERGTGTVFRDVLRFEYQLDDGDTYSFGPVPEHGPWWAELASVRAHPTEPGMLRATHRLTVPAAYDRAEGPVGQTDLIITSDVEMLPQGLLGIRVAYQNTAESGRLRAVFPTGIPARTALVDAHFRWAEREPRDLVTPEERPKRYKAYPGELTYPTHHQGDFTMVEGGAYRVWVANRGLPEMELLAADEETRIAVTLHRAVGYLSVEGGRIRRCHAGPSIPTPGAQCKRSLTADLAFGAGPVPRTEAVRQARAFAHPAWARELPYLPYVRTGTDQASGEGTHLPRAARLCAIDNPSVECVAVKPLPDHRTVAMRLCNASAAAQPVEIQLGFEAGAWCRTSLMEAWNEDDEHSVDDRTITTEIQPHQILTLLIRR